MNVRQSLKMQYERRYIKKMSKVFREWFDTVDKDSQEWLDFVKQQEQDDYMSEKMLEEKS